MSIERMMFRGFLTRKCDLLIIPLTSMFCAYPSRLDQRVIISETGSKEVIFMSSFLFAMTYATHYHYRGKRGQFMKKTRSIYSDKIPCGFHLFGCLKCFGLICVLLCLISSFNALAYEDIIPPGHKPARPGDQEDIQSMREESQYYTPFLRRD